jgi:hypothetical protein
MPAYLSPVFNTYNDNGGLPAAGCKVQVYNAGTTTPTTLFTEISGIIPNTNPVILDSSGYPIQPIWLPAGNYDFTLLDPNNVPLYHLYNVSGSNSVTSGGGGGGGTTIVATEWVDSGIAATFVNATTFRVAGDLTATLLVNRRIKLSYLTTFLYATIKGSVFAAGNTTITVLNDGTGSLVSGIGEIFYGLLSPINNSVPPYLYPTYANDIINGQFRVAQNGTIFNFPITGDYDLDGWLVAFISTASVQVKQDLGLKVGEW